MPVKKRETNDKFIGRLMRGGPFGAMQQMFVLDAIGKLSDKFKDMSPEQMKELDLAHPNSLVHMESWAKCGQWVAKELEAHYKS